MDPNNGQHNAYLYAGALYTGSGGHTFLVKHDLECESNCNTEQDIGTVPIGLAVDVDTSLVYVTTSEPNVAVYDCSTYPFICTYSTPTGGTESGPAGICVPTGDVSYKPPFPALTLTKVDNVNCVNLDDYVTYTISYDANGTAVSGVNIVDYLPQDANYYLSDPCGVYDANEHTVTWEIGDLGANDSNSVTLKVKISELAAAVITNLCEIETESNYMFVTCCVNPCIIYVDCNAPGSNIGVSWENAYIGLQDALEAVRACGCKTEIWVAAANEPYAPTTEPNIFAAFHLINGAALYGGFPPGGGQWAERNPAAYETVLTADIDDDGEADIRYVVKAVDINETAVVDGFTITKGGVGGIYCYYGSPTIRNNKISDSSYGKGIDCDHSDPNITNCIIQDNDNDGIYCNYSNPTIINCIIEDSDGDGIYCNYSNPTIINCLIQNCNQGLYCELYSSPVIANSIIRRNSRDGIKIRYSSASAATVIKNSWICDNGTVGGGDYSGIRLSAPGSATVIRNSTIANNLACGIWASSTGEELEVTNCIAWGNGTNPIYNLWGDFDKVAYCCVEGGYAGGDHIISNDPCFVDDANDNYHLKYDSLCEDAGDPNFNDSNETDIDGQPRNMGDCNETVDIGADEIYFPSCWNCRTQCHGDSDCSGFVDTRDFPPYRDGFMKSYPHPVYIANVCGDWKRDGIISTLDFPEYRDWFFKSPPADCDCGGCWPPGSCEGEGRGQSSGDTADEPSLEEMIDWLIEHDLPGCDEFIRRLYEQVETGS